MTANDTSTTQPSINDIEPVVQMALWGYDLRGSWPLEITALISEGRFYPTTEWDRPDWRDGVLWHGDERKEIPWSWALPWVGEATPSRRMWSKP